MRDVVEVEALARASRSPSVGGAIRSRRARIVATASTAPAAPSRCPIEDFSDETGILYACSPSASFSAAVSAASLSDVDVPCALM